MMKWPSESEINALPSDGGDQFNRLIFEDRLYLKSHAHQAINWYPWGNAAFELAAITNKPLFLSIGYSSCHYCHVMSKTTFDHPAVAKRLNESFVAIKIDKDQYPDIDQLYMNATQLLTEHGGWPNSLFCLPTGEPFFAGTYFPAEDTPNGPGFLTLLNEMAHAWKHNLDDIKQQAKEVERAILSMNRLHQQPNQSLALRQHYQSCIQTLRTQFDTDNGGFGSAPKFPPFSALRLLMTPEPAMVEQTLTAMALSGLYDQVEGGFHRYCTDAHWHLPHFEKILMDNAQMIELYSLMHQHQASDLFKRVVSDTIAHLQSAWALPNGGFCSSMDADSNGEEGRYYAVSMEELRALTDHKTLSEWADYFQLTPNGNMLDEATKHPTGLNIFHPTHATPPFNLDAFKTILFGFRQQHRTPPGCDPAFIAHANAWLAKSLFIAANTFNVSAWDTLANDTLTTTMTHIRKNHTKVYADDATYALSACLSTDNRSSDIDYLWQLIMDRFYDPTHGGLWYAQESHLIPITRIKDIYDRQAPSPNGVFMQCATQLYQRTKHPHYFKCVNDTLHSFLSTCAQSPVGNETYWLAVESYWSQFTATKGLQMHVASCIKDDNQILTIELSFTLATGSFIDASAPISMHGINNLTWLQYQVDPCSSRRVDWSPNILETAAGTIQVKGRFKMAHVPDTICVMLPICSPSQCLPPVPIHIPVC
jgi:uncharacterized protein YyaL (SSP411 family)